MRRIACLLLALLPTLGACRAERVTGTFPWEGGDSVATGEQSFRWQGQLRSYILRLPSRNAASRPPLLIALHGSGGTGAGMESYSGFTPIADSAGFVLVYPDAPGHVWNAGAFTASMSGFRDDVAYFAVLIDSMVARYRVDPGRVYVAGHSNGGFMAYRLAQELADRVAGIAPVAAIEFDPRGPDSGREVTVLHLHALNDPTVLYGARSIGGSPSFPVDSTIAWWITHNHCNPRPDTLIDAAGVLARRWRSASGQGDVLLYTTLTGGHAWPRPDLNNLPAAAVIVEYFRGLRARAR